MMIVRDTTSTTANATESPTVEPLMAAVPETDSVRNVNRANL